MNNLQVEALFKFKEIEQIWATTGNGQLPDRVRKLLGVDKSTALIIAFLADYFFSNADDSQDFIGDNLIQ